MKIRTAKARAFFDKLIDYRYFENTLNNDELKYIYWNMRYIISDILLDPFADPTLLYPLSVTLLYPLSVYYYEERLSN